MPNPKKVRNAILDVVENQIRNLDPPATSETLQRLISEGVAEDEARRLIGCVVASEIFGILKHRKPFNQERYIMALRRLPELPY